jgi:hypothetical protein
LGVLELVTWLYAASNEFIEHILDILSIPHSSFGMFLQVNAAVAAGTLRTVTASVATVPVSSAAVAGAPVSIATVSMAPVQIPPPVVTMAQPTLAVEGTIL